MYRDSPAREPRSDEEALRRKQHKAMLYRRRRLRFIVTLAVGTVFLIVVIVVAVAASRNSSQLAPGQLLAGGTRSPTAPFSASSEDRPAFARFGDRNLLLPVASADATIIAYQPVSDTRAVALTPVGQRVNVNGFVRFFRGLFSGTPSMRYYQLAGADNEPTTSVLIGAQPDTPVTSPVSGVVVRVREYLLFGKYDDVQIDIRPEELGGTLVTLLFINDPAVTPGTRVEAGKTLLGKVRRCPEEIAKILSEFTHDSGSHVHLQVSEEPTR
jgi:hypothetical protein